MGSSCSHRLVSVQGLGSKSIAAQALARLPTEAFSALVPHQITKGEFESGVFQLNVVQVSLYAGEDGRGRSYVNVEQKVTNNTGVVVYGARQAEILKGEIDANIELALY